MQAKTYIHTYRELGKGAMAFHISIHVHAGGRGQMETGRWECGQAGKRIGIGSLEVRQQWRKAGSKEGVRSSCRKVGREVGKQAEWNGVKQ